MNHFFANKKGSPTVLIKGVEKGHIAVTALALFWLFFLVSPPVHAADLPISAFGKGPVEVRIYTDYFCAPCRAEEADVLALISELVNRHLIQVIFIDTPIHKETILFAGYFLSGLNAIKKGDLRQAIALRSALFEAAAQKIAGKEALEVFLKKKGIALQPFDTAPVFKTFSRYLQEDKVNATPTCVIIGLWGKQSLTGKDEILKGLRDLRARPQ